MSSSAVSESVFLPISFALPLFFFNHCIIPCHLSDRPSIFLSLPRSASTRVLVLSQQWCLHLRDLSLIDARSVSQTSSSNTSRLCLLQKLLENTLSPLSFLFLLWNKILYLVTFNFIVKASLLSSQNPRDRLPNNQWWQKSWPGKNPEQEQASICVYISQPVW